MKHRIKNIIETLKRVPPPRQEGETLRVPVLLEIWEHEIHNETKLTSRTITTLTLHAKTYGIGSERWLEWEMDV